MSRELQRRRTRVASRHPLRDTRAVTVFPRSSVFVFLFRPVTAKAMIPSMDSENATELWKLPKTESWTSLRKFYLRTFTPSLQEYSLQVLDIRRTTRLLSSRALHSFWFWMSHNTTPGLPLWDVAGRHSLRPKSGVIEIHSMSFLAFASLL
ncbi:unnamed protein product [Cyclocybe aegerita]|uniref:Uncharacterized protein n=1 Tax=Cyclocybe aegerita TaxID=1973307 RepID=A0A8S0VUJ8_CYCAE|nr:unnamed protein product [Cyclocybe aegerita]